MIFSGTPTTSPTTDPSTNPTTQPTDSTAEPTTQPTASPTTEPTTDPTSNPTTQPTASPTFDFISFGVTTSSDNWSVSAGSPVTISLWKGRTIYECTKTLSSVSTTYVCDSWNITVDACNWSSDYKLVIDNNNDNGVGIDSVFLRTQDANYTIDAWCKPDNDGNVGETEYSFNSCDSGYTAYDILCIDKEATDCAPYVVVMYFNTSDNGGTSYDAEWGDATELCVHPSDGCGCDGLFSRIVCECMFQKLA